MKKLFMFLLVLALVGTAVYAEGEKNPKPGLTMFGVTGTADIRPTSDGVAEISDVDADGNADVTTATQLGSPVVANFSVKPWALLDWDQARIVAAANYDALRGNNVVNYSSVALISTWKNLFGWSIAHTYMWHNLGNGLDFTNDEEDTQIAAAQFGEPVIGSGGANPNINRINATYKNDNLTLDMQWAADKLFGIADFAGGENLGNIFTAWEQVKLQYNADNIAGELIWRKPTELFATLDGRQWAEAWVELKNLFDVYTVKINSADEMKLRLAQLDTDITYDDERNSFGIGKGNRFQGGAREMDWTGADGTTVESGTVMNILHTVKPMDALTVKIATVVDGPNQDRGLAAWLADDVLSLGAEYAINGVGTIGAGSLIRMDVQGLYTANNVLSGELYLGPKGLMGYYAAVDNGAPVNSLAYLSEGLGFWLDAKLDGLLPGVAMVSVDTELGKYADAKATADRKAKDSTVHTANYNLTNIGLEYSQNITETIAVAAAVNAPLTMLSGFDYVKATGAEKFEATPAADIVGEDTEALWLADQLDTLEIENTIGFRLRADVGINYMLGLWVENDLAVGAQNFYGEEVVTGQKAFYGSTIEDELEIGLKAAANQNTTIKVSGSYNFVFGGPSAADFYPSGANDDAKATIDSAFKTWQADNFDTWGVKISYSYKY